MIFFSLKNEIICLGLIPVPMPEDLSGTNRPDDTKQTQRGKKNLADGNKKIR